MENISFTQETIDKFKSKSNMLKHARYIKGKTKGIFLVDDLNGSLIGYIGWERKKIICFEITKIYQGKGYGKYLINKAKEANCSYLFVNKNNLKAIRFYVQHGFKMSNTKYGNNMRMFLKK